MTVITLSASTVRAILCYIDPSTTPKIAYNRDDLAIPLIDKLKEALHDKDGSQKVLLVFENDEEELSNQFRGVCHNIKMVFETISGDAGVPSAYFN